MISQLIDGSSFLFLLYSGRPDDEHAVLGEGRRHGVRVDPRRNHVPVQSDNGFDVTQFMLLIEQNFRVVQQKIIPEIGVF